MRYDADGWDISLYSNPENLKGISTQINSARRNRD